MAILSGIYNSDLTDELVELCQLLKINYIVMK